MSHSESSRHVLHTIPWQDRHFAYFLPIRDLSFHPFKIIIHGAVYDFNKFHLVFFFPSWISPLWFYLKSHHYTPGRLIFLLFPPGSLPLLPCTLQYISRSLGERRKVLFRFFRAPPVGGRVPVSIPPRMPCHPDHTTSRSLLKSGNACATSGADSLVFAR